MASICTTNLIPSSLKQANYTSLDFPRSFLYGWRSTYSSPTTMCRLMFGCSGINTRTNVLQPVCRCPIWKLAKTHKALPTRRWHQHLCFLPCFSVKIPHRSSELFAQYVWSTLALDPTKTKSMLFSTSQVVRVHARRSDQPDFIIAGKERVPTSIKAAGFAHTWTPRVGRSCETDLTMAYCASYVK